MSLVGLSISAGITFGANKNANWLFIIRDITILIAACMIHDRWTKINFNLPLSADNAKDVSSIPSSGIGGLIVGRTHPIFHQAGSDKTHKYSAVTIPASPNSAASLEM